VSLIRFQEFHNIVVTICIIYLIYLNKEKLDLISNPRCGVNDNPTVCMHRKMLNEYIYTGR
jgi:hypothetical protein